MRVEYLRSGPGILNMIQEVFNIMGFSLITACNVESARGTAYQVCAMLAFILSGCFLIAQVFNLQVKIPVNWTRVQVFYCTIFAVFYLIVAALALDGVETIRFGGLSQKITPDEYTAAGSIGIIATVIYLIEAIYRIIVQV